MAIGLLYTLFALMLLALGWLRSDLGRKEFQRTDDRVFVASGVVVALTSTATLKSRVEFVLMDLGYLICLHRSKMAVC